MGTIQRENIDLRNVKTVFHGSQKLKMKMDGYMYILEYLGKIHTSFWILTFASFPYSTNV
jgi:hypothetical protein